MKESFKINQRERITQKNKHEVCEESESVPPYCLRPQMIRMEGKDERSSEK